MCVTATAGLKFISLTKIRKCFDEKKQDLLRSRSCP
jgi:hypothetical protein